MGNYSKYKYVNTVFGGTGGMTVPTGTTAERTPGVVVGTLRYNTDLGLIEQYNALGWQSVDAPPAVTNTTGTINENTNSTITITGSNFKTGAIIAIEGAAVGGIPRALSTTFVSTTTLTAASNAAAVNYVGGAGFDIKVTNPSGLSGTLGNAGVIDRDPVWSTPTGTYSVFDGSRSQTLTFAAADPDGGTTTFSLLSGSLPAGATLNTTTGGISGFSAVASDTSSAFTLRATSSVGSQAADRTFTILVRAPIVQSFTATGASTFNVPTGVTAVEVLVVAGGGAGGNQHGAGAGAGGLIFRPGFPVTPGGSVPVNVGVGGTGMPSGGSNGLFADSIGRDSNFGTLVAKGGGIGPSHGGGGGIPGGPGGSGGGGNSDPSGTPPGGPGIQPSQPGDSGTFGFGNSGGNGLPGPGFPNWVGGGGGGAGAAGTGAQGSHGGNGGVGRAYSISGSSIFYAGGGGGGQHGGGSPPAGQGIGGNGGGGDGNRTAHNSTNNQPGPRGLGGTANRGGGGGGSASAGATTTDPGGSGIVIVKY